MSAKTATPKQPKAAKSTEPTIFVVRAILSDRLTFGPSPTDEQRRILMQSVVKKWPKQFELKASDEVKSALESMRISWTEKK